jgi:hypothetical protein
VYLREKGASALSTLACSDEIDLPLTALAEFVNDFPTFVFHGVSPIGQDGLLVLGLRRDASAQG